MKLKKGYFSYGKDQAMKFLPGDLVMLKGFNQKNSSDVPLGLVVRYMGDKKYKINWVNEVLARRWALGPLIEAEKIELINSPREISAEVN